MSEKELKFEKLQERYLDKILSIEEEAFSDPWTLDMFMMEMHLENSEACVLLLNSDLIGYGCLRIINDEGHIMNLAVLKDKRGQGYGEKILLFLLNVGIKHKLKRFFLEVRTSNIAAISLYKKYDFKINRCRYKYYKSGEDAFEMSKEAGL